MCLNPSWNPVPYQLSKLLSLNRLLQGIVGANLYAFPVEEIIGTKRGRFLPIRLPSFLP